jgi:hypothetical protein
MPSDHKFTLSLLRSVVAGQQLYILMEEVMQGWSLVKVDSAQGEQSRMGLIPSSHYAFTSELELSPQVIANTPPLPPVPLATLENSSFTSHRTTSLDSNTLAPISPQVTGAPSRRLVAKSINRFSSFVTSGAEEWINYGNTRDLAPSTLARRNASDDSQVAEDPYSHDRPELFFTEVGSISNYWEKFPDFVTLLDTTGVACGYTKLSRDGAFSFKAEFHAWICLYRLFRDSDVSKLVRAACYRL